MVIFQLTTFEQKFLFWAAVLACLLAFDLLILLLRTGRTVHRRRQIKKTEKQTAGDQHV